MQVDEELREGTNELLFRQAEIRADLDSNNSGLPGENLKIISRHVSCRPSTNTRRIVSAPRFKVSSSMFFVRTCRWVGENPCAEF